VVESEGELIIVTALSDQVDRHARAVANRRPYVICAAAHIRHIRDAIAAYRDRPEGLFNHDLAVAQVRTASRLRTDQKETLSERVAELLDQIQNVDAIVQQERILFGLSPIKFLICQHLIPSPFLPSVADSYLAALQNPVAPTPDIDFDDGIAIALTTFTKQLTPILVADPLLRYFTQREIVGISFER
jgi:hypothetical protein